MEPGQEPGPGTWLSPRELQAPGLQHHLWGPAQFWPLKLVAPNETHLQPDVGGKVGDVQLQCVQGGGQLWGDARQGLQEALVEKEAAVQLVQATRLGGRVGESGDTAWDAPLRAPAWSLENWGAFQVSLLPRPLISLLPSGLTSCRDWLEQLLRGAWGMPRECPSSTSSSGWHSLWTAHCGGKDAG